MNATEKEFWKRAAEAGCVSILETDQSKTCVNNGNSAVNGLAGSSLHKGDAVESITNSPLGRPVETWVEGVEDPPELQNRKKPYYENKQERPNHRMMIELAAKGYDVKEIAKMTGYTPVCVNNILRQPNLQKALVSDIRKQVSADEEVVEVIRQNVVKAVKLYESVLDDPKADIKAKMEAAERMLNRRYGKPNQPINRGSDVDLNELPDSELLKMAKGN